MRDYLNIELLKTKIKPLTNLEFNDKLQVDSIGIDTFRTISKLYGAGVVLSDKADSNMYDFGEKCIYISTKEVTDFKLAKFFCHELSHRIQHILIEQSYYNISKKDLILLIYKDADLAYFYEQVADRLSYFIYTRYFTPKKHHRSFYDYSSKFGRIQAMIVRYMYLKAVGKFNHNDLTKKEL